MTQKDNHTERKEKNGANAIIIKKVKRLIKKRKGNENEKVDFYCCCSDEHDNDIC